MNGESDIQKLIKKLSNKLGSPADNDVLAIIPATDCRYEELVGFLENSQRLFRNSFCFRQPSAYAFVRSYAIGECLTLIFFSKKSNIAIELNLLRIEHRPTDNRIFDMTSYTIEICRFNYKKSIGNIKNYRMLVDCASPDNQPFYKERKKIFELKFYKTHHWKWLYGLMDWLGIGRKKRQRRDRIYYLLRELEKDMAWYANNKLVTIKF